MISDPHTKYNLRQGEHEEPQNKTIIKKAVFFWVVFGYSDCLLSYIF